MLLAELEIFHTRPAVPTRRVALGHMVLPVEPAPGFGGLLLGAVVAQHIVGVVDDLVPDVRRLIDEVERGERIVQPRLRHRFQADRHGLSHSRHRLIGEGDDIEFDFGATGSDLAQVLGAIYATERLDPASRHLVAPLLRKATRWRGPIGPALIAYLGGSQAHELSSLADPLGVGARRARASRPAAIGPRTRRSRRAIGSACAPCTPTTAVIGRRRARRSSTSTPPGGSCRARNHDMTTLLLYPGAGSDSNHPSLLAIERAVAPVRCVRADFPYRQAGRKAPDRAEVLMASIRETLAGLPADEPLVMGGRSMGGRMCSMVAAGVDGQPAPANLRGLVLISLSAAPARAAGEAARRPPAGDPGADAVHLRHRTTRSASPTSSRTGRRRCRPRPRSRTCGWRARATTSRAATTRIAGRGQWRSSARVASPTGTASSGLSASSSRWAVSGNDASTTATTTTWPRATSAITPP